VPDCECNADFPFCWIKSYAGLGLCETATGTRTEELCSDKIYGCTQSFGVTEEGYVCPNTEFGHKNDACKYEATRLANKKEDYDAHNKKHIETGYLSVDVLPGPAWTDVPQP